MYQHLIHPLRAAREAFRICKKGGYFAVLDIDASMQRFSQDLPATKALNEKLTAKQKQSGGDREIGAKLPSILQAAGFSSINVALESISTLEISLEEFYAITIGFAEWMIEDEEGQKLYQSSVQELANADASLFGILPVVFAYGIKP